jgi:hypothetical protein
MCSICQIAEKDGIKAVDIKDAAVAIMNALDGTYSLAGACVRAFVCSFVR